MKRLSDNERDFIRKKCCNDIGRYIKRKRNKDGATQEELAKQLNVNRSTISHYENGTRDMPISSFVVIGECLGYNLKDYILDIESHKAVDLYENAIYRERGRDKPFSIGYVATISPTTYTQSDKRKDLLSQALEVYFESDISQNAKRMLVLADMLYRTMPDKSAMNTAYESIVREIADTGNRQMDAIFMEFISIVRNER